MELPLNTYHFSERNLNSKLSFEENSVRTLGAEDHVPSLSRGIISGDLGVEEASADVRLLGLVLVGDHTLIILLRDLRNFGRSLCGDLGSDRR